MSRHDSVKEKLTGGDELKPCDICILSKSMQLPYNHSRPRASRLLKNIHVDLSGIVRQKGLNLEQYYILFCDNHSSYRHMYPLRGKDKTEVH